MTLEEAYKSVFTDYPDVVSVDEFREMLGGIDRKKAYALLHNGEIKFRKCGQHYKIPKVFVFEYLGIISL